MVLLIGEGPHYTFHVVAATRREAMRQLLKAWTVHARQTGASDNIKDALTLNYIDNVELGQVYRDYAPLRLEK